MRILFCYSHFIFRISPLFNPILTNSILIQFARKLFHRKIIWHNSCCSWFNIALLCNGVEYSGFASCLYPKIECRLSLYSVYIFCFTNNIHSTRQKYFRHQFPNDDRCHTLCVELISGYFSIAIHKIHTSHNAFRACVSNSKKA